MYRYVLNLNVQDNGDYEVHKEGCHKFPISNLKELGNHMNCDSAVRKAKTETSLGRINGCIHCARLCHTT